MNTNNRRQLKPAFSLPRCLPWRWVFMVAGLFYGRGTFIGAPVVFMYGGGLC